MKSTCATLLLLSFVPLTSAQDALELVLEGQAIGTVGNAVAITNLEVNASGEWLVEVDTDNPDLSIDFVILRNGTIFQVEGDPVSAPAGANADTFDSMILNGAGELVQNFTLGNTGSTTDNAGIYFNGNLVLQKGQPATATGFGAGTLFGSFEDVQLGAVSNRQIYMRGWVDDPTVPTTGTTDWVAMLLDIDANGNLTGQTLIAKESQVLPGQTAFINTVRSGPHAGAFNNLGAVIFGCDLDGSVDDGVVYHWSGGVFTLLAQEGQPSGVGGLLWADLLSPEVDINDAGDWTIKDKLQTSAATDGIIVKNGAKFVQEGDSLPAIAPWVFDDFGNGAAALTQAGDVLWYGEWNDPDTTVDSGLFLNDQLIVQEGVSTGGGVILDTIGKQSENYRISPDGRYVIFEATRLGGLEGAFLLDLGGPGPVTFCTAKTTSVCGPATISASGVPSATAASGFTLSAAPTRGCRSGLLLYSNQPIVPGVPFGGPGDGMLCLTPSGLRRAGPIESGGTSPAACDGVMGIDMNAFRALSWAAMGCTPPSGQTNPAGFLGNIGTLVNTQIWGRDSTTTGQVLSDGASYTVGP